MKTIFVAENDVVIGMDLKMTLSNIGYSVLGIASSAAETVRCVKQRKPDIVVMDVHLSGLQSGVDAAKEIQKRDFIPVLFITGLPGLEIPKTGKRSEANAVLSKPFSSQELKAALKALLKLKNNRIHGSEKSKAKDRIKR